MPDNSKKFHEFALRSALFKGRTDWYFCYLKAEKISHVLWILQEGETRLGEVAARSSELPHAVARMACGELDMRAVLSDVFGLLSELRLSMTQGLLNKETGTLLCREYEEMAQRLAAGSHPSPFVTAEDFKVTPLPELSAPPLAIKDISDIKKTSVKVSNTEQSERTSLILDYIRTHKQASIKQIAQVVKGCSEKTIQRELGTLIDKGLVRKLGERRWSVYTLLN